MMMNLKIRIHRSSHLIFITVVGCILVVLCTHAIFSPGFEPAPAKQETKVSSLTSGLINTLTPVDLTTSEQLKLFDEVWGIINETYINPNFNGIDWIAIGVDYRKKIRAGLSD